MTSHKPRRFRAFRAEFSQNAHFFGEILIFGGFSCDNKDLN